MTNPEFDPNVSRHVNIDFPPITPADVERLIGNALNPDPDGSADIDPEARSQHRPRG